MNELEELDRQDLLLWRQGEKIFEGTQEKIEKGKMFEQHKKV